MSKRILIETDEIVNKLLAQSDYGGEERETVEKAIGLFLEMVLDHVAADPVWYTDSPRSPFTGDWDKALQQAKATVLAQWAALPPHLVDSGNYNQRLAEAERDRLAFCGYEDSDR